MLIQPQISYKGTLSRARILITRPVRPKPQQLIAEKRHDVIRQRHLPNNNMGDLTTKTGWQEPSDWHDRPVCVLGGGVLGRRIAACFVSAGHHVIIRDPSAKSRQDAEDYVRENISAFTALSGKEPGSCEAIEDLATAVSNCWIVFEAVPEILSLKEDTFADLERYTRDDCILATNSSSYKSGDLVGKIKSETKARVLNTHFMMPPQVRKHPCER